MRYLPYFFIEIQKMYASRAGFLSTPLSLVCSTPEQSFFKGGKGIESFAGSMGAVPSIVLALYMVQGA